MDRENYLVKKSICAAMAFDQNSRQRRATDKNRSPANHYKHIDWNMTRSNFFYIILGIHVLWNIRIDNNIKFYRCI